MGNQSCCTRDDLRKSLDIDLTRECSKDNQAFPQDFTNRPTEDLFSFESEKKRALNVNNRPRSITSSITKSFAKDDKPSEQAKYSYVNRESFRSERDFNDELFDAFVSNYAPVVLPKKVKLSNDVSFGEEEEVIEDFGNGNMLVLELEAEKYWPEQEFGRARGVSEEKEELSLVEYDSFRSPTVDKEAKEAFRASLPLVSIPERCCKEENNDDSITPRFSSNFHVPEKVHTGSVKRVKAEENIAFSKGTNAMLNTMMKNANNARKRRSPSGRYELKEEEIK